MQCVRLSTEVRFPDPPVYLREADSMPEGVLSGSPSAADAVGELEGGRVNAHALDDLPNIGGNHRRVTHPLLRAMHRRIDDSHDFALVETDRFEATL